MPSDSQAKQLPTIAVLGAGKVGSSIARAAVSAGYPVRVAGSGSVDKIALTAEILMPGAIPMTAEHAVDGAEIVVLAVPMHKFRSVSPKALRGKVLIDTMNHWVPVNGEMDELDNDPRSTSEIIAEFFDGAHVVKSLNHIGYHELEEDAVHTEGTTRRALAYASDHPEAGKMVATLIDRLGFDAVSIGSLSNGRILEPGQEVFGARFTKESLEKLALARF